jgi:hypothetical protein
MTRSSCIFLLVWFEDNDLLWLPYSLDISHAVQLLYSQLEAQKTIACTGETAFPVYIPVCTHAIRNFQPFFVIGMTSGLHDTAGIYTAKCQVNFIEPIGSLFRSTCDCHQGLSGAGVIVAFEGGTFHVVGVKDCAYLAYTFKM